ncbi:metalloregulator ArsR/SmtB family transcription factor [Nocardiopsis sp. CT-R113]|uniref:Metalloregulator ArsR/SmtB family transcription factor n=1 Tax=Nocardiopsis codii TaxID=3065942 RepID=A0ABU7K0Z4_9ACTN|nr:metalloregulator ArsR/SmtB family transcription factor [Nocardiopsis sp. CT-R113]MEE2035830.1 metalloregulator ArsR/SmtB family transcription factor [Nocardiopsis sp. CT-R113]
MAPREQEHPALNDVELVTVLSALAEPTRLRIVRMLAAMEGERAWKDIDLPIAQSTLSHHLKILRNAGLVQNRTEGTRCFISLRDAELEGRFPGLLESVLACRDAAVIRAAEESESRRDHGGTEDSSVPAAP